MLPSSHVPIGRASTVKCKGHSPICLKIYEIFNILCLKGQEAFLRQERHVATENGAVAVADEFHPQPAETKAEINPGRPLYALVQARKPGQPKKDVSRRTAIVKKQQKTHKQKLVKQLPLGRYSFAYLRRSTTATNSNPESRSSLPSLKGRPRHEENFFRFLCPPPPGRSGCLFNLMSLLYTVQDRLLSNG